MCTENPRRGWRNLLAMVSVFVMIHPFELRAEGGPVVTVPPGFVYQEQLTDLAIPTNVELSPDGRIFVAEKRGIVKVFDNWQDTQPDTFIDLRTNVFNYWDRGLLGLALHPDFPATPYVYVMYTLDALPGEQPPKWGVPGQSNDSCPTPPGPTEDGCAVGGRLSRLEASGNFAVGPEVVLVENWCQQFPSHSMGDIVFGPDGALYATAGEGASFLWVDYGQAGDPPNPCGDPPGGVGGEQTPPFAEGGALRSQDLLTPGDPVAYNGSVIRIDPITGAAFAGNPLIGNSVPDDDPIVAHGLRNPYRFTFRPGTTEIYLGDVGWSDFEEINLLESPTGSLTNFGWPCYAGYGPQEAWDAADLAICEGLYNSPGAVTPPYFAYNQNEELLPGTTCSSGNSSIAGMAFMPANAPATQYAGALFVADYSRRCIWTMLPGQNGRPDPATRKVFMEGDVGPVDIHALDSGDMVLVDIVAGSVGRIRYVLDNSPPVAVISADPQSGVAPLTTSFHGYGSYDPEEAGPLTYQWDVDGDGIYDDHNGPEFSHQFAVPGTYTVSLRVTDVGGEKGYASVQVAVADSPPEATIIAPTGDTAWAVGDSVYFSGSGYDAQDGSLPPEAMTWAVTIEHCPGGCHTHPLTGFEGVSEGSFIAPDHTFPSHLKIVLTVEDSAGGKDTTEFHYYPQSVVLTIDSDPQGVEVAVGESTGVTPFEREVIVNSVFTISAPPTTAQAGKLFKFNSWSDGGGQSHEAVAPAGPATFKTTYYDACGDGELDDGEDCDDGNNGAGDCCAADCSFDPTDTPCPSEGGGCLKGLCDGAGSCVTVPDESSCDDGVGCTIDACVDGTCQHTPDHAACDDGVACTDDTCAKGACQHVPNHALCDDGVACTEDACANGTCQHTPNHAACDDGVACTEDTCADGTCQHAPNHALCDDGVACTEDTCAKGACQHAPNHAACDDGVACTEDTCADGACQHAPNHAACDDGIDCTLDTCADGTCQNVQEHSLCDDGNPCTQDSCFPAAGCVSNPNVAPCDDGDPCTQGDTCGEGNCLPGPPKDCDDGISCTLDSCDEGICKHAPQAGCCFKDSDCPVAGQHCVQSNHTCQDLVCVPCTANEECGGESDLCVQTQLGGACGPSCENGSDCPEGTSCQLVAAAEAKVCLPTAGPCGCFPEKKTTCFEGHLQVLNACGTPVDMLENCGMRGCVEGACCPVGWYQEGAVCVEEFVPEPVPDNAPDVIAGPEENDYEIIEDVNVIEDYEIIEVSDVVEVVPEPDLAADLPGIDRAPELVGIEPSSDAPSQADDLETDGETVAADQADEGVVFTVDEGPRGGKGCSGSDRPASAAGFLLLLLVGLLGMAAGRARLSRRTRSFYNVGR